MVFSIRPAIFLSQDDLDRKKSISIPADLIIDCVDIAAAKVYRFVPADFLDNGFQSASQGNAIYF